MLGFRRFFKTHPLLDVHVSAARARLQEITSFRADFLVGTLAVIAQQVIVLIFLYIMFVHSQTIGGYDFPGVLLLFGLGMGVQSLSHILFEGLHILGPRHVERGEFDLMLVRPGHPLLHILSAFFQISGILPFFLGIGIAAFALFLTSRVFFPLALCLLPFTIASGTLVLGGVILASSSLAFRFRRVRTVRRTLQSLEPTLMYPLDIFPERLQTLFLSLLPFGWAAFGPSKYFLSGDLRWLVASISAGPLAAGLGLYIFTFLSKSYESTGT